MSAMHESDTESLFAPGSVSGEASRRPATISLLEADPDLGSALSPDTAAAAVRAARARFVDLDAGPWSPDPPDDPAGDLGLLVVSGLISRSMTIGSERSTELLGAGDVLRPWAEDGWGTVYGTTEWDVLSPVRVAILDRAFAGRIARWPELTAELFDRAVRRCRSQSIVVATSHIKRVDVRLLALFFHLAERWGRVTRDGIVIPLRLTHARLAALVGAQRPSVTTALSRMTERGAIGRTPDGHTVLREPARAELERLCLSGEARHLRLLRDG